MYSVRTVSPELSAAVEERRLRWREGDNCPLCVSMPAVSRTAAAALHVVVGVARRGSCGTPNRGSNQKGLDTNERTRKKPEEEISEDGKGGGG